MKTSLLALPTAALLLGGAASAQTPDYPNFAGATGLALVESAIQSSVIARITPNTGSSRGAIWFDQKVSVASGFDTTFTFRIFQTGADGMAFVIHDDPAGVGAIGNIGGALGYAGFADAPADSLDRALVIELDCWANQATSGPDQYDDPDDNHISIHTGGTGDCEAKEEFSLGRVSPATDLNDGQVHTMRVRYVPGTLDVFLDDVVTPILSVPYDFGTGGTYLTTAPAGGLGLTNGEAYVGFTGATGGVSQIHDVLSWTWDGGDPIVVGCDPAQDHYLGDYVKLDTSSFGSGIGSDLNLQATDGPANEFAFVIVSADGTAQINVFNGVLCLGTPQGRYNPFTATNQGFPQINSLAQFDASGVMRSLTGNATSTGGTGFDVPLELPFSPAGQVIQPGDTWVFQVWYRDVISMPGDSANFSNTVSVTFP